jgi:hypothetical protein
VTTITISCGSETDCSRIIGTPWTKRLNIWSSRLCPGIVIRWVAFCVQARCSPPRTTADNSTSMLRRQVQAYRSRLLRMYIRMVTVLTDNDCVLMRLFATTVGFGGTSSHPPMVCISVEKLVNLHRDGNWRIEASHEMWQPDLSVYHHYNGPSPSA